MSIPELFFYHTMSGCYVSVIPYNSSVSVKYTLHTLSITMSLSPTPIFLTEDTTTSTTTPSSSTIIDHSGPCAGGYRKCDVHRCGVCDEEDRQVLLKWCGYKVKHEWSLKVKCNKLNVTST